MMRSKCLYVDASRKSILYIYQNMKRNFLGNSIGFIFYFFFYTILVFEFSTPSICYLYKFKKELKKEIFKSAA